MPELPDLPNLRDLRSGATGQPAVRSGAGELAELRRQQQECSWDDATPLVRDSAAAYAEVVGPRVKAQQQAKPRPSTFL